ncbi:hypothetical protein ACKWTF_006736 [Chironomus riparius]
MLRAHQYVIETVLSFMSNINIANAREIMKKNLQNINNFIFEISINNSKTKSHFKLKHSCANLFDFCAIYNLNERNLNCFNNIISTVVIWTIICAKINAK